MTESISKPRHVVTQSDTVPREPKADASMVNGKRRRLRILYIYPETMGLSPDPATNPLHFLSDRLEGDYVAIWVVGDVATAGARVAAINAASGRFRFHWSRFRQFPLGLRRLWDFAFWLYKGVTLSLRHGRYDAIVAYGPFTTALAGMVIRLVTGAKLIVEFPGHPFRSYELYPGWAARLKRRIAPFWTRFIALAADHVRLLYSSQLDELKGDYSQKHSAFHDFTPVRWAIDAGATAAEDGRYVLFLGFPFFLKGVDVLIEAFNRISARFPEHGLLIVGHCPDPALYAEMAAGNPQIEIRSAVPHDEAMALIARCSVFVLPSRSEGMGRVLLEAMAAGRPVIGSAVGGIPFYIKHGHTGLLFESESVDQLADRLALVLSDSELAGDLGRQARDVVAAGLTEEHYANAFACMVERVVS
jgi:glycosyltransferase involved in cell wall biosynthesis